MDGAEGSNNIVESEINLKIALRLQNLLEQSGATVLLTRSDENGIYDMESNTIREKKISDIKNRVKIGNESSADIFVSIHLNKILQQNVSGSQAFYSNNSLEGKSLAKYIQDSLNNEINKEKIKTPSSIDGVYIMKHVEIPTSIVECGFLSNKQEEEALCTEEYQNKLAWSIYLGINDYFNSLR